MLTPQEFANTYAGQAQAVAAGTGLDPNALLVQWGVETSWGNQVYNANNLGNIRCLQGIPCLNGFAQFGSLTAFCDAAIATWRNGFYPAVLASAGQPVEVQLRAIGASPWDAGHYDNGGGPGSSLLAAAQLLNLGDDFLNTLSPEAQIELVYRIADLHKHFIDSDKAAPESFGGNPPVPPIMAPGATQLA